jgi:hypothetical protein
MPAQKASLRRVSDWGKVFCSPNVIVPTHASKLVRFPCQSAQSQIIRAWFGMRTKCLRKCSTERPLPTTTRATKTEPRLNSERKCVKCICALTRVWERKREIPKQSLETERSLASWNKGTDMSLLSFLFFFALRFSPLGLDLFRRCCVILLLFSRTRRRGDAVYYRSGEVEMLWCPPDSVPSSSKRILSFHRAQSIPHPYTNRQYSIVQYCIAGIFSFPTNIST